MCNCKQSAKQQIKFKEFKAKCKNSGESKLKRQKQSEKSFRLVMLSVLQLLMFTSLDLMKC